MIHTCLNWIISQAPILKIAYRIGAWDAFNQCQTDHQKIINEMQKFYLKTLGPKKFLELQRLYAQQKS